MLVHVGTKLLRTELGTVADYCPLCHEVRPCTLHRVTSPFHVNYIELGKGDFVRNEIRCNTCRLVRPAHPDLFQNVGRSGATDFKMLIERTQPEVRSRHAREIALDERMRQGKLTREERHEILLAELKLAEALVAPRASEQHFDPWAGLGCFMTAFGAPAAAGCIAEALGASKDVSLVMLCLAALIALGATLVALATDVRRHARKAIVPHVARAVRSLGTDLDEIEAALEECEAAGLKIGRAVRAVDLDRAIVRAASGG